MSDSRAFDDARGVLVVVPNWVGDVVLATPTLAAVRAQFADAQVAFLMRPYVAQVVAGGGWHDEELFWSARRGFARERDHLRLARRVRDAGFDLAILLTNSFRSALLTRLARVPRRVGFARDGRGWLLTHRLKPLHENGRYVPFPVSRSYAQIAQRAGCSIKDLKPRLVVTPQQERAGAELKRQYGLDDGRPYVVVNPGAAFGAAKCWLPERFAEVCDRLCEEFGYRCVIVGAPQEAPLMRHIAGLARSAKRAGSSTAHRAVAHVVCCENPGTTLGSLKPVVRDAALLVCNDTGPRHYGNAFNVPTLTIFGPTHQAWTHTDYGGEVRLQVPVECGPCQLRACPLDHRCMTGVTTEMVIEGVRRLVNGRRQDHNGVTRSCRPC